MGMLLIRNAHLIDGETDRMGDLLILDGRIVKIADKLDCPADETVDVGGCVVMPGLVDMHVHLRDPGYLYKEDILRDRKSVV